jgi:CRP/FNR family cyclic AMP-dependent transcriptional regulator
VREAPDVLRGLARSYLFKDLTEDELTPLAAVATTRQLVRGEYVWRVGDPADEICVVLEGEIKDSVLDTEGNEIIHFVHGPGMTFGEPGYFAVDHDRVVANVALGPSVIIRLMRREFAPFIEAHPSIKDRALEAFASHTRWQSTVITALVRRPLIERVGLRLLELLDSSTDSPPGVRATSKISQSTLAAMVGVSRENVNRALATLVSSGFVRHDNGRYVIEDEDGLRQRLSRDWPIVQPPR